MKTQRVPDNMQFTFSEHLFNKPSHRQLQQNEGWISFYDVKEKQSKVLASWHLHLDGTSAFSPSRATFGGFDYYEQFPLKSLSSFVGHVTKELSKQNVTELMVTLPPQIYHQEKFVKSTQALVDNGFTNIDTQTCTTIVVDMPSFEDKIHRSEKRRLKKCVDYSFEQLRPNHFHEVYTFLAKCREERGHSLSMPQDQLYDVLMEHQDDFKLFCVFDADTIIAAAICIRVLKDVLYVFYGGHAKSYDQTSPAVLLYKGIYSHCFSNHYRLLDLGTSASDYVTDYELLRFKTNIGGQPNLKSTYHKFL